MFEKHERTEDPFRIILNNVQRDIFQIAFQQCKKAYDTSSVKIANI